MSAPRTTGPVRQYTLQHSIPESRTRWAIPEEFLSREPFHRQDQTKPVRSIVAMDVALPDMTAWTKSGLDFAVPEDKKRLVSVSIVASSDFAIEKKTLPRLLEKELQLVGEFGSGLLKYRRLSAIQKDQFEPKNRNPFFFLIPKDKVLGRAVFFECARVCIGTSDFSDNTVVKYSFDLELVADWMVIDSKVRELLKQFVQK